MKVLIIVPNLNKLGGVALHYKGLKPFWKEDVKYYEIVSLPIGRFNRILNTLVFIIKFLLFNPQVVVLNTSLKEGFFYQENALAIAKFFKKKVLIFIHGWDAIDEQKYLGCKRGKSFLESADLVYVLSSQFRDAIHKYGISANVKLTTTKVDNRLLDGFDINKKEFQNRRFLFVARLIKEKGIYESLRVFDDIKKVYPDASFTIVGDGNERENVERYISEKGLYDVKVKGSLSGQALIDEFCNADYYFLITFWGEGIPGSLLEAISFGLIPIIRGEGGIPEIFSDGEMGIMSMEKSPEYFTSRLLEVMKNPQSAKNIALHNYEVGQSRFLASIVAAKYEADLRKM